jgi:hypothetical protein
MDGRAAMTTSNVEEFDWFLRFSIATQARNIRPLAASMQSFYGNIRVKGVIHSVSVCLSLNVPVSFQIWAYSLLLVHAA